MNKLYPSAKAALQGLVKDGQTIAVGGFGVCGVPEALVEALRASGVKELTCISNNAGLDDFGLGLFARHAPDPQDDRLVRGGEQGVRTPVPGRRTGTGIHPAGHAGRADAGRRSRDPGVLHPDRVRHGRCRRQGDTRVRGPSLRDGTLAAIRRVAGEGLEGRPAGQPRYRKTARNFNPVVAMCGQVTVAEVEILVDNGELDADQVHTPGIFVKRLVVNSHPSRRIEQRTVRAAGA